jgi:hypothetical protein
MGYDNNSLLTVEEMLEYGVESVQTISEATFAPKILIRFRDGKKLSLNLSPNMIQDLKALTPLTKIDFKDIIKREIENELYKYPLQPKKEIKRVYSDLDPYGEEQWEN